MKKTAKDTSIMGFFPTFKAIVFTKRSNKPLDMELTPACSLK
jgi:hypothetical protein